MVERKEQLPDKEILDEEGEKWITVISGNNFANCSVQAREQVVRHALKMSYLKGRLAGLRAKEPEAKSDAWENWLAGDDKLVGS